MITGFFGSGPVLHSAARGGMGAAPFLVMVAPGTQPPSAVTPPSTPSLTVLDNGDGTGGLGIVGNTSGSALNTVYFAAFTGLPSSFNLSSFGTVTGSGTLALGLPDGPYFFQCVSQLGSLSLPSPLVYATFTGPPTLPGLTLLQAIVGFFNLSPVLPFFPSGLWVEEIPEEKTFPLLAIFHNGERPAETTEGEYLETGNVQFELFAVGLANAESLALKIKQTFDPLCQTNLAGAGLTIQNGVAIKMERQDYKVTTVEGRDPNQNKVYQITMPYECEVRKKLGLS